MALKIKTPSEIAIKVVIKALLYGPGGIGKSTLALSAPDPLNVDCDNGIGRVASRHWKDTQTVECWSDITDILTVDLTPYQTIVIDPVGKMLAMMDESLGKPGTAYKQADGTLTIKGYAIRAQMFKDFVNRITALGKNVIFVAHEKERTKKKGKEEATTFIQPDIAGQSKDDLMRELDLVGFLEMIDGMRTVSFDPTESHAGKNTLGLDPIIALPDVRVSENNFMTKIVERYQLQADHNKEEQLRYTALMDGFKASLEAVTSADAANELMASVVSSPAIWDSATIMRKAIFTKATELGLIVNTAEKRFDQPPVPEPEPEPPVNPAPTKDDKKVGKGVDPAKLDKDPADQKL